MNGPVGHGLDRARPGRRLRMGATMQIETPSILITDDDRALRETLQSALEPQGFRTLLAEDGEEALEIVRREVVHLGLLDMHMPKLTGLETLRRIKQIRRVLPCILVSAALDDVLAEQARRAQAFGVHAKPIRFAELMKIVRRAMSLTYGWPGGN